MPVPTNAKRGLGGIFSKIAEIGTDAVQGGLTGVGQAITDVSQPFGQALGAGLAGRAAQFVIEDGPRGRTDFATTGNEAQIAAEVRRLFASGGLVLSDGGGVARQGTVPEPGAVTFDPTTLLLIGGGLLAIVLVTR